MEILNTELCFNLFQDPAKIDRDVLNVRTSNSSLQVLELPLMFTNCMESKHYPKLKINCWLCEIYVRPDPKWPWLDKYNSNPVRLDPTYIVTEFSESDQTLSLNATWLQQVKDPVCKEVL